MKCLHIIKKSVAAAAGLKFFASHRLCPRGHFSERWVAGGGCVECRKEKYWANCEEIKARERERLAGKKDIKKIQNRKYYLENKEKIYQQNRDYAKKNLVKVREWAKASYERNRTARLANGKIHYENNPHMYKAMRQRRRSAMSNAEGEFTKDDLAALFERQHGKCAICTIKLKQKGKGKYHADHIQPLCKGGTNYISNIQLTCPKCNLSKGGKDPIQFAQENGKLL